MDSEEVPREELALNAKPDAPLGGENPPMRLCNRLVAGKDAHCNEPAVFHVAWNWNSSPDCSFVCMGHYKEVGRWNFFQIHRMGDDCGMPGAMWDGNENRCVYPDGLPVAEEAEELVVQA